MHRFQLKVGGTVGDDVRRVRAVLDATGERETVIADANGGWGQLDARRAIEALAALAPDTRLFVEQPCQTMKACAAVAVGRRHPMLLDEVIVDLPALIRAHRLGALDGFNLKIGRVGGLTPARQDTRHRCRPGPVGHHRGHLGRRRHHRGGQPPGGEHPALHAAQRVVH